MLSRGLQHPSPVVQLLSLQLLEQVLLGLAPLMEAAEQLASAPPPAPEHPAGDNPSQLQQGSSQVPPSGAAVPATAAATGQLPSEPAREAWGAFLRSLRAIVRSRVPDPSTLLLLHAALERKANASSQAAGHGQAAGTGTAAGNGQAAGNGTAQAAAAPGGPNSGGSQGAVKGGAAAAAAAAGAGVAPAEGGDGGGGTDAAGGAQPVVAVEGDEPDADFQELEAAVFGEEGARSDGGGDGGEEQQQQEGREQGAADATGVAGGVAVDAAAAAAAAGRRREKVLLVLLRVRTGSAGH